MKINKEHNINWKNLSFDEKVAVCTKRNMHLSYKVSNHNWNNYIQFSRLNTPTTFSPEEKTAINNYKWTNDISREETSLERSKLKLDTINTKLLVRECDIEYKFMDREKREFKWENRGENDTAYYYCVCCGGAIPNVPQLVIGAQYGQYSIRICAICMGKLSQEAIIQAKKVPQDILDHYNSDRFLRELG